MIRRRVLLGALLCFAVAAACGAPPPSPPAPAPASRAWAETIVAARTQADSGRYATADSLLSSYAAAYPESGEAREVPYWRAVLKADPANKEARLQDAIPLLETYVAYGPAMPHATEAAVLRRTLELLESYRAPVATSTAHPANGPPADTAPVRSAQDEILRLQAELDKTKEELERVRRRLRAKP